jgi:hypothetical protein
MSERHVKHLIVTDSEGCLEGIVSRGDLLAVFVRPDAEILREISQDVVLGVFWIDPATLRIRGCCFGRWPGGRPWDTGC